MRNQQIKIDKERCIGCGLCTKVCVTHNIKFQDKKIPIEVINQILEAGRLTHTAKNMQDVSFVVLDKENMCNDLSIRISRCKISAVCTT